MDDTLDWFTRTTIYYALWALNRITGLYTKGRDQAGLYIKHLRRAHSTRHAYFYLGSHIPLVRYACDEQSIFSQEYSPKWSYCFDTRMFLTLGSDEYPIQFPRNSRLPWITASFVKGEGEEKEEVDITDYVTGVRYDGEPPTVAVLAMAYLLENEVIDDVSTLKLAYMDRDGVKGVLESADPLIVPVCVPSEASAETKEEDTYSTDAVMGAADGPKIE